MGRLLSTGPRSASTLMPTIRRGIGGPCGHAVLKGYTLDPDGNLSPKRCADWAKPEVVREGPVSKQRPGANRLAPSQSNSPPTFLRRRV
jgi:hypothetical protein